MIGRIARRLRYLLRLNKSEEDLDREIRFHLDMEADDRKQSGMTLNDARRLARADFGSIISCKEDVREALGLRLWYDFKRDLQYAFRSMRRRPGFSLLTIVTLAAGIGAATAAFAVVDRTILKTLPYREPNKLVHISETRADQDFAQMEASYPNYEDWLRTNTVFEGIAGLNGTNFTMTGFGPPVRISAMRVTSNLFQLLGVQPQLGRGFTREEDVYGKPHVVVVTHVFWQGQLGGRPDVLLQSLRLNGELHQIVGVLPQQFQFQAGESQLFVPLEATPALMQRRQVHWLITIGRMKPGIGIAQAEAEMKRIADRLASDHPDTNTGTSVQLVPWRERMFPRLRSPLMVVFGAAALMLFLAFANVANLMVAQSVSRQREIGIRTAIGAGTFRLARQLIAECMAFAFVAGVVALAVAAGILEWIAQSSIIATDLARMGGRAFVFSFSLAFIAGLLAGGLVALRIPRRALTEAIKTGGWAGGSAQTLRWGFTASEIALAVILLVGAITMVHSVERLMRVDPGFKADHLISMNLALPGSAYRQPGDIVRFYDQLRRNVAAMPGVEKAAVVDELPLTKDGGTVRAYVHGQAQPKAGEEQEAVTRSASPGYFETMGIRLIRGRTFAETDVSAADRVAILSETLARKLFGEADPVGQRIVLQSDKSVWNIAGVVGDVHLGDLDRAVRPALYTCSMQDPSRSSFLVIRTNSGVEPMARAVRAEVQQLDPELPVYGVRSIEDTINQTPGVATRKLVLQLIGGFGTIGALMAGIGLYGLMSFLVVQRSKEIGIRVALGARRGNVRRLILNQAMLMTVAGLAAGILLAIAATGLIRNVMFEVTPADPTVLVTVAGIVGAIAYAACYFPVSRAIRIDPIIVLRQD